MYENNFDVCTSFNVNLFHHPSQQAFTSLSNHFKKSKCFFYHENSFDLKNKNKQIVFNDVPNNVLLLDLYKENTWLEDFLKNSTFNKLINHPEYWKRNSQYWFRKVVSIVDFINKSHNVEFGMWFDCDTNVIKHIDDVFFDYIKNYDWCCYFRHPDNGSIESGIQIFKFNDKTREFAKKYLQYFLSENVFKEETNFADNYVLNSCFDKFGTNLKIGRLNTKESFNVYNYIRHNKATLQKAREQL